MSGELAHAVAEARDVVSRHPQHGLPLARRQPIWRAFGMDRTGHAIRGRLAIACARRVSDLWLHEFPTLDFPTRATEVGLDVIAGSMDRTAGWDLLSRFHTAFESVSSGPVAYAAALSALLSLEVALNDEWALHLAWRPEWPDPEERKGDEDAAAAAAVAYAGGRIDDSASSAERRLEFWLWYLETAIPAALAESK
jgi:hypothetical protein